MNAHLVTTLRRAAWKPLRFGALGVLLSQAGVASAHAQWDARPSGTTAELRGLSVVSSQVVWASGTHGTVLRTTDGGATWEVDTVADAATLDLRAIAGTSAMVAHAISIGDSSRIYRTTDGGRTWSRRWSATKKGTFLDAIRFWDAKHGVAVSDPVDGHFLVLVTGDGGDSWREIAAERIPAALAGEGGFAASGSCLEVGSSGNAWFGSGGAASARVYRSTDGGEHWTVHDTPLRAATASAGIFSLSFRDGMHGVAVGGDYAKPSLRGRLVALTADGGATWTATDSASGPSGYRSAVSIVPRTEGRAMVAVGLNGTDLSRDGGASWTAVDSVGYNSVLFASPRVGWAVGPAGRVARWKGPSLARRSRPTR